MKKRLLSVILCLGLTVLLTACGSSGKTDIEDNVQSTDSIGNQENEDNTDIPERSNVEEIDPNTYQMSSINTLDGVFRLDASKETLKDLGKEMYHLRLQSFDSKEYESQFAQFSNVSVYLYSAWDEAVTINRTAGEKLILVGQEGGNSDAEIEMRMVSVLGYGNQSMLTNIDTSEIEEINGIDISMVNTNQEEVNDAIKGTGISCHSYASIGTGGNYGQIVLADKLDSEFTYSSYQGTEYTTTKISMINPFYLVEEEVPSTRVPVQKTQEGYFVIDISSLTAGIYIFHSYTGARAVNIE